MRKTLILLIQGAVTVTVLIFVFRDTGKRAEMLMVLRSADLAWLAGGFLVYGTVEALGTVRMRILLGLQGFRAGWFFSARLLLVAVFFTLFSPGLVGGDAIRLYYLAGENPERKPAAFAVVIMDRVLGLMSLIVMAAFVVSFRYSWLTQTGATKWLVHLTCLVLCGGITLMAIFLLASRLRFQIPAWMPLSKQIAEAARALASYRKHGKACCIAFTVTLVAHLAYYAAFFCAARAFHQDGTRAIAPGDIFSIMPVANTLVALPVSFAGVGVREAIFQTFLGDLVHVSAALAVLIASTGFLFYLAWGLVGGLLFFAFPPKQLTARS